MGMGADLKVCKFRVRQTAKETKLYKFNVIATAKEGFDVYEKFYSLPRTVEAHTTLAMQLRSMRNNETFIGIYGDDTGLRSVYYYSRSGNDELKTI